MWVLSHRGVRGPARENTYEAFEAAVAQGVDGIETDVHRTRDGVLVLHHDADVHGAPIADTTHADLEAKAGHVLPTVRGALDRWPDLVWNLELKAHAAVDPLIELLRTRRPGRFVVSSFLHPAAARFGPEAACRAAVLIDHEPLDGGLPFELWRAAGLETVVVYFGVLSARVREQIGHAGFACWTYGPVTQAQHATCRDWALEAVITDWPERART